jgi:transposase, IS30 family
MSRLLGKRKILKKEELLSFVEEKLKIAWSPKQITTKLKELYTDTSIHLSHEAMYQYIYVLPKGTLKRTLIEGLRQSRKYRRTKKEVREFEETRGKIKDMLSIHERPAEVADRTVPGHWEGDLIIGKHKRTAIATLVERTTRYTKIVSLPHGKDALSVKTALTEALKFIPSHLKRTLTYDQGKEMSQHKQFTIDTGIQVYFADPSSPWQRGTNENTNGLIRQFFPKGTDFPLISKEEIQRVEDLLNGRPRACIGFAFPKEKFYDLVALDC